MEQARAVLQRALVELVGEDSSRGLHVVIVRDSWFQPHAYRTKEPSLATVAAVERQLRPTQTMQERVERMCVVGNSWPLCLARAMGLRREKERRLRRRGMFREAYARKKFRKRHRGATGREQQARAEAAAAQSPATGAGGEGAGDAAAGVDASGPPGESEDAPSESFFQKKPPTRPAAAAMMMILRALWLICALWDLCHPWMRAVRAVRRRAWMRRGHLGDRTTPPASLSTDTCALADMPSSGICAIRGCGLPSG